MKTITQAFFKYPLQFAFALTVLLIAQICGLLEKGIALVFQKACMMTPKNCNDKTGPACEPPESQGFTPARTRQASCLQREGKTKEQTPSKLDRPANRPTARLG